MGQTTAKFLKIGSCETTWVASALTPCAVIVDQWSSAAKTCFHSFIWHAITFWN